jgi:hypothetical protein
MKYKIIFLDTIERQPGIYISGLKKNVNIVIYLKFFLIINYTENEKLTNKNYLVFFYNKNAHTAA